MVASPLLFIVSHKSSTQPSSCSLNSFSSSFQVKAHLTMADTDLIARLYPFDDDFFYASETIELNRSRYNPSGRPRPSLAAQSDSRRDRQSTQEPEDHGDKLDNKACLQLRFSHGSQTRHGMVLGLDPLSDIVLLNVPGISFHHLAITFDQQNRLIVQDLGSSHGTEVTYENEGKGERSDFVWIVSGHRVPQQMRSIVIKLHKNFKFLMIVYHHEITSQHYIDNVHRFRQGTADAGLLVDRLVLRSRPQTEHASGAHTPGSGPIHIRKKLGEGSFGVVTHCWNVSTGDEYALKEPSENSIKKNKVDVNSWKKEARIMGQISHVS